MGLAGQATAPTAQPAQSSASHVSNNISAADTGNSREGGHIGHHHQHASEHRLVARPHSLHLRSSSSSSGMVEAQRCDGASKHKPLGALHTNLPPPDVHTWSLRRMTSMVRGSEPAGTCTVGEEATGVREPAQSCHTATAHVGRGARSTGSREVNWLLPTWCARNSIQHPQLLQRSPAAAPRPGSPAPWPSASPQSRTGPSPGSSASCCLRHGEDRSVHQGRNHHLVCCQPKHACRSHCAPAGSHKLAPPQPPHCCRWHATYGVTTSLPPSSSCLPPPATPAALPHAAHALVAAGGVGADHRLCVLELLLHILHHCTHRERRSQTGQVQVSRRRLGGSPLSPPAAACAWRLQLSPAPLLRTLR